MTHSIAILGASGYTGAELVRLIATHPTFEITALAADRKAGMAMAANIPIIATVTSNDDPPATPKRGTKIETSPAKKLLRGWRISSF